MCSFFYLRFKNVIEGGNRPDLIRGLLRLQRPRLLDSWDLDRVERLQSINWDRLRVGFSMASTQAKGVRGESFDLPSQSNFNRPIATMNRLVQLLALVLIASLLLVDIASAAEVRRISTWRAVATRFWR